MRRKGMRFPNGIPRAETELLQVDTSVHSSLRGRISEVLREFLRCDGDGYRDGGREWVNFDHLADAVIAALNLNTPVEYLSVDGKRRNFMVAGNYTVEVSND